jgi:phosphoserine phosphatase
VYQEALDLIELHRENGRAVYLVSSSPEEVVRPLAEHFGVNGVVATRAEVEDGKYTGRLAFYCFGEGKAEAIRALAQSEGIDLEDSYAYSDSHTDLPMLEEVGNPVAVNPSRELRREADGRGWQVHDFRRPIPLRRRLGMGPRRAVPVAAVAIAAVAAGIAGWAFLRPRRPRRD